MEYRKLGRTGLEASVIGFGAEWIGKMEQAEVNAMVARGAAAGVNIVDCWMSDPAVRSALGEALEPTRDQWIIQGHIGSTWQDGQYVRTRELDQVRPAFEDLLERLRTDHVELGMIHYVDACDEFRAIMDGPFIEYVRELLAAGKIGHVGLSTHNPEVALLACDEPEIEVIMFSLNPAFDMMPASEDLEDLFGDYENVAGDGIEPVRARLYASGRGEGCGPHGDEGLRGRAPAFRRRVALRGGAHAGAVHPLRADPPGGGERHGGRAKSWNSWKRPWPTRAPPPPSATMRACWPGRPSTPICGQCTYCGHCAPCTVGINIALSNKFADLAEMAGEVPASVAAHYKAIDVTAGACIACGDCEPRCPFDVPIIERMEKTEELFGC